MKCIQCGVDNNLRERTQNSGRCKQCQHPFVFDPKAGSRFSDLFFQKSIHLISNQDQLFFTKKQFYYLLKNKLSKKHGNDFWITFIVLSILISIYSFVFMGYVSIWIVVGIGIIGLVQIYNMLQSSKYSDKTTQPFSLQLSELDDGLSRWIPVNGNLERLLPSPQEENNTRFMSPEISSYSFDRVVICDNAAIAQFLIANNFHFDHHCAILSGTGYPESIFGSVLQMLKRNPELTVYALHNASPRGMRLVHRLRNSSQWFGDRNVEIYDVGLRPRHVFASKNLFIRNSPESQQQAQQMSPEIRQTLSPKELEWLEKGNFVELESFMPRKLLRILTQSLTVNRTEWQNDSTILVTETDSYSSSSFG